MFNSDQFQRAIVWAEQELADKGYQEADLRVVLYAGFGWLDHHNTLREQGTIHIKLMGKKFFAIGLGIGGVIVGALIKFLGG